LNYKFLNELNPKVNQSKKGFCGHVQTAPNSYYISYVLLFLNSLTIKHMCCVIPMCMHLTWSELIDPFIKTHWKHYALLRYYTLVH